MVGRNKPSLLYKETRQILQLAIPLASAQLAHGLTGFFDTLMMGHLGASTLAAGGLASMTLMTLLSIVSGVLMGVSPLVAEAYGGGNKNRVAQLSCQGLWLVLLLTIPLMIAIAFTDSIMLFLGQSESTVALGKTYLDIMIWGCFPALGFMLLRGIISSLDDARPVMLVVIAGTIFNIIGNYVLAFGKLGFPRLEIAGLAIATVITFWGMFLALLIYMMRHQRIKTMVCLILYIYSNPQLLAS